MPSYVPLSKSAHRFAGLVPAGYAYALDQPVVPVVAEELPHMLPTMALAFVASPVGEGYDQPGRHRQGRGQGTVSYR